VSRLEGLQPAWNRVGHAGILTYWYAFFEREFPGLVERWLAERGERP